LISPYLVGGETPKSLFRATDLNQANGVIGLRLIGQETLRDDVVWLRYGVVRNEFPDRSGGASA
jgi:hypothetical protein